MYEKKRNLYYDNYYNMFWSNFKFNGLDYRQLHYFKDRMWKRGCLAAFKIKFTDEIGFACYVDQNYLRDMYGNPSSVQLTNEWNSPVVPSGYLVVDEDVVVGYLNTTRSKLDNVVNTYVKKIAAVDKVINTNLNLHKMPYVISTDETGNDKNKLSDVIDRVMNDESVITLLKNDLDKIEVFNLDTPYIIDKLVNYKRSLENELKTILGIDNKGDEKIEQLQLSEVNANNCEINSYLLDYLNNMQEFFDRINEAFNTNISVELSQGLIYADGEYHENEEKPGPKESENE